PLLYREAGGTEQEIQRAADRIFIIHYMDEPGVGHGSRSRTCSLARNFRQIAAHCKCHCHRALPSDAVRLPRHPWAWQRREGVGQASWISKMREFLLSVSRRSI